MNFLQIQSAVADSLSLANTVDGATEVEMNLLDMAVKGGWIMIVLAILLVVALYIFFERIYVIRKSSKLDDSFMNRIKDYIVEGKIDSALKICEKSQSPSARMIEKGISRLGRPMSDVLVAIENVGNIETAKLEKGFTMLASISGGAPMIGFFGTVTGMIRAFYDMANAGNNVDITILSGGIYEAMITTVGGLAVGIIAYFAHNYLVGRVNKAVQNMETTTMEFLDILNEPA
ncbi:MAG: MotA/TolQ/ExbB proton channel family protein [Paludibacteraceae bacterium]|nr:MotA/TolQ/ExbB proton channel family protein [Paludibacteraceae bacterium]